MTVKEKSAAGVEFSRVIAVEGITPDKIRHETIEATPAECAALAKRLDLRELEYFRARINIRRVAGGTAIRLEGHIEAEAVQACVVSLQDVHTHVESSFETFFSEDGKSDDEIDFSQEGAENIPEPVVNGVIDLGEVSAQYLSLELDPYPRAPGVSLAAQMSETGG
ncbi:MAG: DUF177 domain-containing protein [Alphaproteobacteria bacterium]|nr:DUF177 domain-containing protein [Alphaproteobacteria bacterium]